MHELFEAIINNDFGKFKQILSQNPDQVHNHYRYKPSYYNVTPKNQAVYDRIYQTHLKDGILPTTLLGCATIVANDEIVRYLVLNCGVDVNQFDLIGYTPLLLLTMRDHADIKNEVRGRIAEFLIMHGADIYLQDRTKRSEHTSPYKICADFFNRSMTQRLVGNITQHLCNFPIHVTPVIISRHQNLCAKEQKPIPAHLSANDGCRII